MDGLALLCNLFADGPVTLKRLRLARVTSLTELERTPPAHLAEWLHASEPQVRGFVEEARKLRRRLADEHAPPLPVLRPARAEGAAEPARGPESLPGTPLRPGVLPGLDEALCARLQRQKVHTLQALSERAGLDLARRTGIPYSRLLELARAARRQPRESPTPESTRELRTPALAAEPEVTLVPAPRRPAPLADAELAGSDAFTLPAPEPEAAGPFV